jgi:hypothetical protein
MKKTNLLIFILLMLIIASGITIYFQNSPIPEQTIQTIQPAIPPEPIKKSIVHYPVPEQIDEHRTPPPEQNNSVQPIASKLPETLPTIPESDQSIQQALENLLNGETLHNLLYMENFIQKLVATIDNLAEKRLPKTLLPITPPAGKFIVAGTSEAPQASSRNHKRYIPYLTLLESIDQDMAIKIYVHFYPLFQTAYKQLGYKNAYFNDRLVYVIDHLLETPNPPDPILLAQPSVLYTYANPSLENLSAGQKILLRIGQDQRSKTLEILEDYQKKLTNLQL